MDSQDSRKLTPSPEPSPARSPARSPSPKGHSSTARHLPPTIAMGGGTFELAANGSSAAGSAAGSMADGSAAGSAADSTAAGSAANGSSAPRRHPEWIKARIPSGETYQDLRRLLHGLKLNTVCEEAHCPNMGECWDERTATVMILGDVCTRACGFCAIKTGKPLVHDLDEPRRVAEAIRGLRLDHVVITSVARDDLDDGGAGIFADTIRRLRVACPDMGVEVLIPDFNGEEEPLRTVMTAGPDILNHNVETVARLQKPVRKRARYDRSLGVLLRAKAYALEFAAAPLRSLATAESTERSIAVHTKSSIMVGLGETRPELHQTFLDLRAVDCDILTLGQYLRPSPEHLPVERYYHPDEFAEMRAEALALGFKHVESGPLVRSSYHARDQVPGAGARRAAREAGASAGVASPAATESDRRGPTVAADGRVVYRPD
jgi:lipoic acid synthetase